MWCDKLRLGLRRRAIRLIVAVAALSSFLLPLCGRHQSVHERGSVSPISISWATHSKHPADCGRHTSRWRTPTLENNVSATLLINSIPGRQSFRGFGAFAGARFPREPTQQTKRLAMISNGLSGSHWPFEAQITSLFIHEPLQNGRKLANATPAELADRRVKAIDKQRLSEGGRPSNARLSAPGDMIYPVQYLRAFAATAVSVYHIGFIFGWQWRPLAAGVDLFFVVSGFIMWSVTAGKLVRPAEFLSHRIIKIVPLYWLFTIIFVVGASVSPGSFDEASPTVSELAKSLLFIPYSARNGADGPALAVGWTLNIEMYFYLIFAYGLVLKERHRLTYLTVALGTSASARFLSSEVASLNVVASPLLLEFLAGIFIAVWYLSGKALPPKSADMLFIALGVAGVALSFWVGPPVGGSRRVLMWGLPQHSCWLAHFRASATEDNGRSSFFVTSAMPPMRSISRM